MTLPAILTILINLTGMWPILAVAILVQITERGRLNVWCVLDETNILLHIYIQIFLYT